MPIASAANAGAATYYQYAVLSATQELKNQIEAFSQTLTNASYTFSSDGTTLTYSSTDPTTKATTTYSYHKQTVGSSTYWVRDGFTMKVENGYRWEGTNSSGTAVSPSSNAKIVVIANADATDAQKAGILYSTQLASADNGITTLNKDHLFSASETNFTASTNAGIHARSDWDMIIYEGNNVVNAGKTNYSSYFKAATIVSSMPSSPTAGTLYYDQSDGLYKYYSTNGQLSAVNPRKLYSILNASTQATETGIFVINNGQEVYQGNVYGQNNEILLTSTDSTGTIYSYWGGDLYDETLPISMSSMTVADFNEAVSILEGNIEKVHKDNVAHLNFSTETDSSSGVSNGVISLTTNGGADVPGTIKIANSGGTGGSGDDLKIVISGTAKDGKTEQSFSVNAGSLVAANPTSATTTSSEKLTSLSINGTKYEIQDRAVLSGTVSYDASGNGSGKATLTLNDGSTAAVTGLQNTYVDSGTASYDDKGSGTATLTMNDGTTKATVSGLQNTYVASGAVTYGDKGAGTATLKMNDESEVKVTGLQNTYVDSGTASYDSTGSGTATLTMNDGKTTATVSGLKNTYVASGAVTYGDKGPGTATLKMNDESEVKVTGLQNTYVSSGSVSYDASGNGTGKITLTQNDGSTVTIEGLKDTYTKGAAYDSDSSSLVFTRNDGTTYSVSGIASTVAVAAAKTEVKAGSDLVKVTSSVDATDNHTVYTVDVKDMHVKEGSASYTTDGTGTLTLTHQDGTTATVSGLKDTYVKSGSASYESNGSGTVTLKMNDGTTASVTGLKNTVVTSGEATYDTNGSGTATLTMNDGSKASITGLKNTVVTSGEATYDTNGSGTATLTMNDGSKASVTGLKNTVVTSGEATYDTNGSGTATLTMNDGSKASVSGLKNTVVTSGAASYDTNGSGTATLTMNDGSKVDVTGLKNTVVTSGVATYDDNGSGTATLTMNDGTAASVTGLKDTQSRVAAGQNIVVTSSDNEIGTKDYTVSLDAAAARAVVNANTYLSENGINAQGLRITNVAPGEISATSTDAVNGSQLYATNQAVEANSNSITQLNRATQELDRKVKKAGANAAALAALHPLEYDEDHLVTVSAGVGGYHGAAATAFGFFVRPTPNLLFSLGGSIASGNDVMGNLGVSYRFGDNSTARYKTKLNVAERVSTLTNENRDLQAKLQSSNMRLEAADKEVKTLRAGYESLKAELDKIKAHLNIR